MITTTAQTLLEATFKLIGVLGQGRTMSAGEANDGLARLNSMIDSWGVLPSTMFGAGRVTFTTTASVGTYTIGIGATVNQQRPVFLQNADYIIPGSSPEQEVPLWILTDQEYADQQVKGLTSSLPGWIYYAADVPFGIITLGPIPTQVLTIVLYYPIEITQFADLSTQYVLAPGYERAIRYNLALDLAVEWGSPISPLIETQARDALDKIMRPNVAQFDCQLDPAIVHRSSALWNIFAGP